MTLRFGIWLDFRNPGQWHQPPYRLYGETLDLVSHAEHLGFDDVWLSEHHYVEDGYLPSLLTASAAVAARTTRVRVGTNVLLLPLHDPIRVAEDAAALDLLSGGRFDLGVAAGYRNAEFIAAGIDRGTRGARMDEAVQLIRACWSGEEVNYIGHYYQLTGARVLPRPLQVPMPLLIAAMSRLAAERAGRWGTGLLGPELLAPSLSDETGARTVVDTFKRGWSTQHPGERPDVALGPGFGFISEDPDRDAPTVVHHLAYRRALYVSWFREAGASDQPIAAAFEESTFRRQYPSILVSPEEARVRIRGILETFPETTRLYFWAIPPGLGAARAATSLELFAREVIPAFRRSTAGSSG